MQRGTVCNRGSSGASVLTVPDISNINRYVDGVILNEDGSERQIYEPALRKEIVINIMTNFKELQYGMTLSKKIAEALHNRNYISTNKLNQIIEEYVKNVIQSNYLLLICVLASGVERLVNLRFDRIRSFLTQLKQTNQTDLLFIILKTGSKLYRPHTRWIGQSYETLSQNLIINQTLLTYLYSKTVLDMYEIQDINSNSTNHMKVSCLLRLIRMKSLHCYNIFLEALKKAGQSLISQSLHEAQKHDDPSGANSFMEIDNISESSAPCGTDENHQQLLRDSQFRVSNLNPLQRQGVLLSSENIFEFKDFFLRDIMEEEDQCDLNEVDHGTRKPLPSDPSDTLALRNLQKRTAKDNCIAVVENLEKSPEEIFKQFKSLCERRNRNAVIIPVERKL